MNGTIIPYPPQPNSNTGHDMTATASATNSKLSLAYGLQFIDLYQRDGLSKLDQQFIEYLKAADTELHNRLVTARAQVDGEGWDKKEESNLLIAVAPHLEDFIATLFDIESEVDALTKDHSDLAHLFRVKRLFVQRRALKLADVKQADQFDGKALRAQLTEHLNGAAFDELSFAGLVAIWMENEEAHLESLTIAAQYALWAMNNAEGKALHADGVLFKKPKSLDFEHLVPVETELRHGVTVLKLPEHKVHTREGFKLTDPGASLEKVLDNAHYCIFCHNQGKDSCSKGLREKEGGFKQSPMQVTLNGCPLEEKISEMNTLKSEGVALGALAVVTIDNPMCAGTGHRICNDCMKSCIYQKQDPVDIPLVETHILKDVLNLPWGFEIYSLLTRWNPLNLRRPLPKEDMGYKVLVVGLGPAGYTLAHHLLNDGHTVVAVDGLKIEPLPESISGVSVAGERVPFTPIRHISSLYEELDERTLYGFGGVAEYGITVRWDKNFLKLIRLLLERRNQFRMFGGIRFGGTITYDQAFELGFDHVALAMGAGKPTIIPMENAVARGVRTASDFLMSLQLSGAARKDSIANLQLRLPVVVIGGGLTGIDTTTEALAYYPVQVEKFLLRYEALLHEKGEAAVRAAWNEEETEIADEFIAHARAIRDERIQAREEGRDADILSLLKSWGGSTLAYRRNLTDAPSYRLNHEEVEKALEEGIFFLEHASPTKVELDHYGHAKGLHIEIKEISATEPATVTTREAFLPARTVLMAAGTSPNTVLQREEPGRFSLDGKYFQAINMQGDKVSPEWVAKPASPELFVSRHESGRLVSFFGDLHPSYAGNVVKAMGSAKQGYPIVSRALSAQKPTSAESSSDFLAKMNSLLLATVKEVIRLTPNIVEVVVKAPLAARNFRPGQFYRLQNFESNALKATVPLQSSAATGHSALDTTLLMEGLALTGASTDPEAGLLSTIVLEMGGSSDLCAHLKPGEPVILMGPTGEPTHITSGETVMLVGGGLGNAVLFSIGKALKDAGSKVLYFAGYKKAQDRYKVKEIEEASDMIIWCCDEATFSPEREQDRSFHGNIVEAMKAYGSGLLGNLDIPMSDVDRLIVIGSDRMMAAVANARHTVLKPYLKPSHEAIGSINSPMQCMMKEICAQCLQKHVDPKTGKESYVYSCFNQDQCLDKVHFQHLGERLRQNTTQEKLTKQWINHCLEQLSIRTKQVA